MGNTLVQQVARTPNTAPWPNRPQITTPMSLRC